jgi:hypothetical protein
VVRAPGGVNLGLPAGTNGMQSSDLTLDYAGHLYVASGYRTSASGGTVVQALRTSDLAAVSGYPVNLAGQFAVGFARPANSLANAPLLQVPLPALSGLTGSALDAFNVISGGQSSGFAVAIPDVSAYFSGVDAAGVTFVAGVVQVNGHHRVWTGSYAPGGAARGAARVHGTAADSEDNPLAAALDPAGTFYVAGRSYAGAGDYAFWIARVPAF